MDTDVSGSIKPCPPLAGTHAKRARWWMTLEPQWRAAFGQAFFRHAAQPSPQELESLWQTATLRLVGPHAAYPSMNFELTNSSGLAGMENLEILVLTNHRIGNLEELAGLTRLKSLFVNNNALGSLRGIESLTQLEQLYAQVNQLETITPLRTLTRLREVYVGCNVLTNLDGLTPKHAAALRQFVCLPNEGLTDRVTMAFERKLGIRCRSL